MKVKRSLLLYVVPTAITVGSLLPILVLPHTLWDGKLFNEPLHSTIEAMGAFASIVIAWFLSQEKDEKYNEKYFLLAMGFLTMGLFDGFHAVTVLGKGFVLFRSIAALSGGFWFALVWLPRSVVVRIAGWKKWLPFFVAAGSVLFGIWTLLFRETLPLMVKDGTFTITAIAISQLAGVCFLTAVGRLLIDFRHSDKTEIYLIACMSLLFGLSSLVFPYSHVWCPHWWWWHLLRVLASLLVVGLLTHWYLKKVSDFQERDKEMEDINMELALGLSEAFEGLNKVASGDPRSRISEVSKNELIAKLKKTVNETAEGIEAVVNQSHEFAIGLAEHFDVLNRVSKGELSARISEISQDEILKALGRVTNHMIESVSREITERRQAEEEIRRLSEELEQRVLQRTAQLEIANKEMEAFSYSVSHDLRAPLRAIDGFSRLLLEDYGDKYDAEGKRLLNIIRSNTQKMGDLINDLLALSRLGRKEIEISDIDMNKLVDGLFDELGLDASKEKVQFDIKPLPPACGDLGMIRQVLANLLLNAIKFTRPRETAVIEVGGYSEDSRNIYYVKDNGVGFDMQYADKLFGVFQRLHTDKFEGTGVGLSIVQRIINRHGGKIWAEGKVNEGATFYFILPKQ